MPHQAEVVDLKRYRSQQDAQRRRELVAAVRDAAREMSTPQLEAILRAIVRETGRRDLFFSRIFNG